MIAELRVVDNSKLKITFINLSTLFHSKKCYKNMKHLFDIQKSMFAYMRVKFVTHRVAAVVNGKFA